MGLVGLAVGSGCAGGLLAGQTLRPQAGLMVAGGAGRGDRAGGCSCWPGPAPPCRAAAGSTPCWTIRSSAAGRPRWRSVRALSLDRRRAGRLRGAGRRLSTGPRGCSAGFPGEPAAADAVRMGHPADHRHRGPVRGAGGPGLPAVGPLGADVPGSGLRRAGGAGARAGRLRAGAARRRLPAAMALGLCAGRLQMSMPAPSGAAGAGFHWPVMAGALCALGGDAGGWAVGRAPHLRGGGRRRHAPWPDRTPRRPRRTCGRWSAPPGRILLRAAGGPPGHEQRFARGPRHLNRALRCSPTRPRPTCWRFTTWPGDGSRSQAAVEYRLAVERGHPFTYDEVAGWWGQSNVLRAVRQRPNDLLDLANAFVLGGRHRDADAASARAVELAEGREPSPHPPDGDRPGLARSRFMRKAAVELARVAAAPQSVELAAQGLAAGGDLAGARTVLRQGLNANPGDSGMAVRGARILFNHGDWTAPGPCWPSGQRRQRAPAPIASPPSSCWPRSPKSRAAPEAAAAARARVRLQRLQTPLRTHCRAAAANPSRPGLLQGDAHAPGADALRLGQLAQHRRPTGVDLVRRDDDLVDRDRAGQSLSRSTEPSTRRPWITRPCFWGSSSRNPTGVQPQLVVVLQLAHQQLAAVARAVDQHLLAAAALPAAAPDRCAAAGSRPGCRRSPRRSSTPSITSTPREKPSSRKTRYSATTVASQAPPTARTSVAEVAHRGVAPQAPVQARAPGRR